MVGTGADANIISQQIIKNLDLANQVIPTNTIINTFSGEKLPIMGKVEMYFMYNYKKCTDYFYIVNLTCKNIIGLNLAINMNLVRTVKILTTDNIIKNNSDIFEGLGLIENECNLLSRDK